MACRILVPLWGSAESQPLEQGSPPRYFILFDVMVSGIVSLISVSDLLLLVYRNTRNFRVLIFYPEILLNSLMTSISFLVTSLGFSM